MRIGDWEGDTNRQRQKTGHFNPRRKKIRGLILADKLERATAEMIKEKTVGRFKQIAKEKGDFIAYLAGHSTYLRWGNSSGISFFLGCEIPDAAGTGSNTAASVDSNRKRRFVENALISRDRLIEGRKAISNQTACRRLFEALRI